jgi:hypothetical protein
MSINLPNVSSEWFDSQVHTEFYNQGFIFSNASRMRQNVVGDIAHFKRKGQGIATQRQNLQDDVTLMNIDYTDVPVTLQNWNASDLSDIFARAEVNFDETTELVQSVSHAIGRRFDKQSIDSLSASAGTTVPEGGTGFTYDKFLAARKILRANGVFQRNEEIYCAISATAEEQFLKEIEAVSSDFTKNRLIDNGGIDGQQYSQVNFIVVPEMTTGDGAIGDLPLSGDTRTCYMWAKSTLGWAMGIDLKTSVDWIPMKRSWLISADFKGNSVVIDPRGVVKIDVDEAA